VTRGTLHHLEIWVADLRAAERTWGWLLTALGYQAGNEWAGGRSWCLGGSYVVVEQSLALTADDHDRFRPGVNHVAFHAGTQVDVDALAKEACEHGWSLLFADRHPHAGGPQHYAAYLVDEQGFEVELVAN
jgi:catechol 2,3-dioxygenase-like lactoylglutathione lyase family enzyme